MRYPVQGSIMLAACLGVAAAQEAGPKPYVAHKITAPKTATYLLPDGTIYVAGNDLAAPYLEKINALFLKTHPGFKFKMDPTSSGESVAALVATKSAFALTARDVSMVDKAAFESLHGYPVTDVQFGWDNTPDADHFPPNGKFPPTVWVNAKNPISALTLEQLTGVFLSGSKIGDITRWGQISFDEAPVGNNGGDYARREIHVYMPILKGLPVISANRLRLGNGLPWTRRAEYLPQMEDVVNAVANDPFGIGMTGWFPGDEGWDRQSELGSKVRLLPLQKDSESRISHGAPDDLYPLSGGLHLLIDQAPGKPVEPWIKEYVALILSKDGQDVLAGMNKTDGFLPLDAEQVVEEAAKLK